MEKHFVFNDSGVCTNPNMDKVALDDRYYAEVRTAEKDGAWLYAISTNHSTGGHGYGVSLNWNPVFHTEDEALRAGWDEVKEWFDQDFTRESCPPSAKMIEKMRDKIGMRIAWFKQGELF
jgi:hypothetical protein